MTKYEQLKKRFDKERIIRASSLREAGFHAQLITDMIRNGEIIRLGRGVYSLPDGNNTETSDYEILSHVVPKGIICLVSALRFHELTDENPHMISLALEHGYHPPKIDYPPAQFFIFSGQAYSHGIEVHNSNDAELKVYSIAKTIADCFKYRNKIGIDVAVTALREAAQKNVLDYNALWTSAKICRITKIIRPYMEAVQ